MSHVSAEVHRPPGSVSVSIFFPLARSSLFPNEETRQNETSRSILIEVLQPFPIVCPEQASRRKAAREGTRASFGLLVLRKIRVKIYACLKRSTAFAQPIPPSLSLSEKKNEEREGERERWTPPASNGRYCQGILHRAIQDHSFGIVNDSSVAGVPSVTGTQPQQRSRTPQRVGFRPGQTVAFLRLCHLRRCRLLGRSRDTERERRKARERERERERGREVVAGERYR